MQRRSFVKGLGAMLGGGAVLGIRSLGAISALAQQNTSDYKALVCLFLYGGNDSNNVLVPMDQTGYSMYAAARPALALSQSELLPLQKTSLGLHPSMPGSQRLFNQGSMAIIANMGPLVQPTTMSQYQTRAVQLPMNLESHNDQRNCMSSALQTSGYSPGWGGRIADVLAQGGVTPIPMAMSLYGPTPFVNGAQVSGYYPGGGWDCSEGPRCGEITTAAQSFVAAQSGSLLVQADQSLMAKMEVENAAYGRAISQATASSVVFPATGLGGQLEQVTRIMSVRNQLGAGRQIFFVGMQEFDTHTNQLAVQGPLLQQMDEALLAFSQALQAMNLFENVTVFTLSEFTRTLTSNGSGGSDHAWGGHHLVMGGAVKGGQIFGTFPTLECGGPDDILDNGTWLPSTSLNQYAATLALWFGVSPASLVQVLPDIGNFPSPTLGFL